MIKETLAKIASHALLQRLLKGAFWTFIGVLLSRGASFVSIMFVARILGVLDFGKQSIILDTVTLIGSISGLSLGITATRYIAEYRKDNIGKASSIITLVLSVAVISSLIFSIAVFVFSTPITVRYFNDVALSTPLKIGAILLFFNVIENVLLSILLGFEEFKKIAFRNLLVGILTIPLTILGAKYYGITGFLLANVCIKILATLLNLKLLLSILKTYKTKLTFEGIKDTFEIFYAFVIPAFLSGIIVQLTTWYIKSELTHQPNGYIELGYYSASSQIMSIVLVISGIFGTSILPIFISSIKEKNKTLEKLNILISWSIGLFIGLPILYFPQVLNILYGQDYYTETSAYILIVTIITLIIMQYKEGLSRILIANKLMKFSLISNGIWCVITLVMASLLIGTYGALGMAVAMLTAYVINVLIMIPYYIHKGIAPVEVMISRYTISLWVIIITSGLISATKQNITTNVMFFVLSMASVIILIMKIIKKRA